MYKKIILLLIIFFVSCARVQTLNLEKHEYSERPQHIVWFQIAGFSEEHIPLLRFNNPDATYKTNIEKVDCMGKMWSFNLYELRPDSGKSLLSQVSGSKNIKGLCSDYETKPVWSYMSEQGYVSAIIENGANEEQTFEKAILCQKNTLIDPNKLSYYRMGPDAAVGLSQGKKSFHYQDSINAIQDNMKPGIYYDKSCQKNLCYSSVSNNFKTLWGQLIKEQNRSFTLVRDFIFQKALQKKDISFAKESLQEIERMITWIKTQKRDDILILITGAEPLNIEYPKEGKEWAEFERSGKNVIFKNSSLMSPVLATGPMAENFCGLFDESEMLKRVIYRPETKIFSWDSLNPFSN